MTHPNSLLRSGYFFLEKLTDEDYDLIMSLIESRYNEVLRKHCIIVEDYAPVTEYMHVENKLQHELVWTKTNRLLTESQVKTFQTLKLFEEIGFIMGRFNVSDEEGLGYPNIYFRLVRPNEPSDVGPPHADSWFWELAGKPTGERFKVWIPLWPAEGEPAFKFIPGSHMRKDVYGYQSVIRNGQIKPQILGMNLDHNYSYHGHTARFPILFHDDLIHGGNLTRNSLRISVEFTGIRDV